MPLTVYCRYDKASEKSELEESALASSVFTGVRSIATQPSRTGHQGERFYNVQMYQFAVAFDTSQPTALATNGAGGCQIVVVHTGQGMGALAHFAQCKPHKIVNGVGEMCDQLGGKIEDVVFVAGYHGHDSQEKSREQILKDVGEGCPGARVRWFRGEWSTCFYLPLQEELALYKDLPDGAVSTSKSENSVRGITVVTYF